MKDNPYRENGQFDSLIHVELPPEEGGGFVKKTAREKMIGAVESHGNRWEEPLHAEAQWSEFDTKKHEVVPKESGGGYVKKTAIEELDKAGVEAEVRDKEEKENKDWLVRLFHKKLMAIDILNEQALEENVGGLKFRDIRFKNVIEGQYMGHEINICNIPSFSGFIDKQEIEVNVAKALWIVLFRLVGQNMKNRAMRKELLKKRREKLIKKRTATERGITRLLMGTDKSFKKRPTLPESVLNNSRLISGQDSDKPLQLTEGAQTGELDEDEK